MKTLAGQRVRALVGRTRCAARHVARPDSLDHEGAAFVPAVGTPARQRRIRGSSSRQPSRPDWRILNEIDQRFENGRHKLGLHDLFAGPYSGLSVIQIVQHDLLPLYSNPLALGMIRFNRAIGRLFGLIRCGGGALSGSLVHLPAA